MQYYQSDKAIEFNGLYNDIIRIIENFKKAKIDVSSEETRARNVEASCKAAMNSLSTQMNIEIVYQNGIKELEQIKQDLEKHTIYYTLYNQALNIEEKIKKPQTNQDQITMYAHIILDLLTQIQNSDTRVYESEKAVVEKIYNLAYDIIKLELIIKGTSTVLDWVKTNRTASSFINGLIVMDITLLEEKGINNDIIRESLTMIKNNEIVCSYLDEGLILFLAMQNKRSIERVETSLLALINDITVSDNIVNEAKSRHEELAEEIKNLELTIKKSKIYKELRVAVLLFALLAGLRYGGEKGAKFIGHREYKTQFEFYSSESDKTAPTYPEYMPKIKNFGQTTLVAYDVWRQENIFFGDYQRDIITYDLSRIDLANLEDYLTYDFSSMSPSKKTQTEENINVDELYDKAIVEITRFTQDENDRKFVPDEESQELFLLIITIASIALGALGGLNILATIVSKLKDGKTTRLLHKEETAKWQEALLNYKQLCQENEEYRAKFIAQYKRFAQFIKDPQFEKEYQRILK